MQPGRQQHAQSQHAKPSLLQQAVCALRPDAEITVVVKPSRFSANKRIQVKEQGSKGQPSLWCFIFCPAPPSTRSFECAAKSNITDYKTLQSLLVKLPRPRSLHLPQPAFFCPPPASLPVLSSFTGLCCATGCCGPNAGGAPGELSPGPSARTITFAITRNQRRCQ